MQKDSGKPVLRGAAICIPQNHLPAPPRPLTTAVSTLADATEQNTKPTPAANTVPPPSGQHEHPKPEYLLCARHPAERAVFTVCFRVTEECLRGHGGASPQRPKETKAQSGQVLAQGHREEVAEIRAHISVILKLMLLGIPRSLYVFVTIFMCLFLAVLGRGRCGVFSLGE